MRLVGDAARRVLDVLRRDETHEHLPLSATTRAAQVVEQPLWSSRKAQRDQRCELILFSFLSFALSNLDLGPDNICAR